MNLIDWIDGISHTAYMITPEGEIWSTESEQYLTKQDNKGYHEVDLKWEGKRVKAKVHRLVCQAFYGPPPFPKAEVDHLDMDRHNNHKDNLEWVTKSTNIQRRNASGSDPGGKAKKPLAIFNLSTHMCYIAESHTEAMKITGLPANNFYKYMKEPFTIRHRDGNMLIAKIKNPEVLQNERNKNRKKQGHDQRTGKPASPDGIDTTRSPIVTGPARNPGQAQIPREIDEARREQLEALGESARKESEKVALSSLAQETLDRWKVTPKK